MRDIAEVRGQQLRWARPHRFRRYYELHAGTTVVATLHWTSGSLYTAIAETAGPRWRFESAGVFRNRVVTLTEGGSHELADFEITANGGFLKLHSPRTTYIWRKPTFWGSEWLWLRADGTTVMRYRRKWYWSSAELVDLDPHAPVTPDVPLLVTLGFYLIVLVRAAARAWP
jgi:hypothetical protein